MYYNLIYLSKHKTLTVSELEELLKEARKNNAQHEVTGILYYDDKHFIQLIEGPKTNILQLYNNLLKDNRHQEFNLQELKETPARGIPEFYMKYTRNLEEFLTYVKSETVRTTIQNIIQPT